MATVLMYGMVGALVFYQIWLFVDMVDSGLRAFWKREVDRVCGSCGARHGKHYSSCGQRSV